MAGTTVKDFTEEDYFDTKEFKEEDYFAPKETFSEDTYFKESQQLTPETMQEKMEQSRREGVQFKNFDVPEQGDPQSNLDSLFTGDAPTVTEYNQLVNSMDDDQKEKFYQDIEGKSFNEKIGIAKKSYKDKMGFTKKIKTKWNTGVEQVAINEEMNDAWKIEDPKERAKVFKQIAKKRKEFESELPEVEGANFAESSLQSVAEMLPMMIEGTKKGIKTGAVGAATGAAGAAAVGALIPAPEEIVTLPAAAVVGFKTGMTLGSGNYWRKQGRNDIYLDMLEEGIDENIAQNAANIGGVIYGAIEFAQVNKLLRGTPLGRTAMRKTVGKVSQSVLREVMKRYAGTVTEETAEEILQEVTTTTAKRLGQYFDPNKENQELHAYFKEIGDKSVETAKQTIGPMGIMGLAGIPGDIKGAKAEIEIAKKRELTPETETKLKEKGYTEEEIAELETKGFVTKQEIKEEAEGIEPKEEPPIEGKAQEERYIPPKEFEETRYQEDEVLDVSEINETAKKRYGTTDDINEAGYITTKGELLDFSEKKEGGQSGLRSLDHRDVGDLGKGIADIEDFVGIGNIRILPESKAIDFIRPPTKEQRSVIEDYIIDNNGEVIIEIAASPQTWGYVSKNNFRKEYTEGTNFTEIMHDIDSFYKGRTLFQEKKEKPTGKPLLETARAREFLKTIYDVDIDEVKLTKEIIMPNGKKASGMYKDGVTWISHIARGTTYGHEAFHHILDNFAEEGAYQKAAIEAGQAHGQEINKIMADRKLSKEIATEEFLAEEFGKYRQSRHSIRGPLRKMFDELMRTLKRVFGKDKQLARLFRDFETGKAKIEKARTLSQAKFQALPDDSKKRYINKLKALRKKYLQAELKQMRNEAEGYRRGQRVKTSKGYKTAGSELPGWMKEAGFKSEAEALAALKLTSKNFPETMRIANERLAEGVRDIDVPPNEAFVDIERSLQELDVLKEAKKTDVKRPKDIMQREELMEKRKEIKKITKEKEALKEDVKIGERIEIEKQVEIEEVKKEKKKLEGIEEKYISEKQKRLDMIKKIKDKQVTTVEFKNEVMEYVNMIRDPDLKKEVKSKMLAKMKNLKTLLDRAKAIVYVDKVEAEIAKRQAVSKFKKYIGGLDIEKLRPEYEAKVRSLIDPVAFASLSEKRQRRLLSMREYIEEHPEHTIPDSALKELDLLEKKSIRDMTIEDISLLEDTVKHLVALNKLKNKIYMKGKLVDYADKKDQALNNLNRKTEVKTNPDIISTKDTDYAPKGLRGWFRRMLGVHSYNAELVSEIMDKEDKGVIKEIIYNGIDEGRTAELRQQQEAEDFFREGMKGTDISSWAEMFHSERATKKKVDYLKIKLESGKILEITKDQRIAIYLHSLNKDNRKHITEGGLSMPRARAGAMAVLTDADFKNIEDSMTSKEKKAASLIHHYFNDIQKENINKVSVDLNGFEAAKVENYFSIKTNAMDRARNALKLEVMPEDMKTFTNMTLEGAGWTKQRIGAKNAIMLEGAFESVIKSLKLTSAYCGLAKPLRSAKMLLSDPDFQRKVTRTYGRPYLSSLKNYIRDIEDGSFNTEMLDKAAMKFSNRLTVSMLGLNPGVMLKQPVSYWLIGSEMDDKYVGWASKNMAKNIAKPSVEKVVLIEKYSPQTRSRFSGRISRDLGEVASAGEANQFYLDKQSVEQKIIMGGISKFDKGAVLTIWDASLMETKEKNPDLKGDALYEKTAQRMEELIRRTQPTFDPKDRSEIGRSKSVAIRLMTKFTSQRNKNWMINRRAIEKFNRGEQGGKLRAVKSLVLVNLITPLMIALINDFSRAWRRGFKDRDEKKEANMLKKIFTKALETIEISVGNIYYVGTLFRSIRGRLQGGYYAKDYYSVQDPLTASVNELMDALVDTTKGIIQLKDKEKYKRKMKRYGIKKGELKGIRTTQRGMKGLAESGSRFAGVPFANVDRYAVKPLLRFLEPKKKKYKGGY